MSKICNCPNNILTINKDDYEKMIKEIFIKVKKDIKNKYSSLIYEKNYNIDSFDRSLRKIIVDYNYYNNKNYIMNNENLFNNNYNGLYYDPEGKYYYYHNNDDANNDNEDENANSYYYTLKPFPK